MPKFVVAISFGLFVFGAYLTLASMRVVPFTPRFAFIPADPTSLFLIALSFLIIGGIGMMVVPSLLKGNE